ncbi:peptidoglycan/LPS O-acetylase OafA/YrhL [Silvibacterium bohemicum]|uniref:Peptidoglycan/LPS O-acetylase OafA/YrhL n=1 Tax=Silvibacterium bohemicum TaxID=1577686 RepID=A0A841JV40_9BACT|nr:acyltransferase [Silvibacterium bohemicum]MBB6142298.1 peptidoglycan/LPS O-acetylase OafA/YrhL [Silvibacterium bohemicum]
MALANVIEQPAATASSPRHWYAGLDGVRAIAVTLVFTLHYLGARTLAVGWTGVPIFFVLSGFLITGILYDNRSELHRFRNFYVRRTLRIFPLYYFAWILILLAALLLAGQWRPIHFLWLTYLGNYIRLIAGNKLPDRIYTFNGPRLPLEIGHFWSLAVEEQFYLIWPFIVFHLRERKKLIRICILTIVFVPILRAVLWKLLPENTLSMDFLYRMTFTQCDAFLLGGLLALWLRGPEKDRMLRHSNKIFGVSLVLFVAAYLANNHWRLGYLSTSSGWVSTYGFSLIDFAAAGLILCSLRPSSVVSRVMTLPPLRFLGRYSYGFYVYHVPLQPLLRHSFQPVLKLFPAHVRSFGEALAVALYFLIVLFVSVCSYHLIELPFLRMKDRFTVRDANPGAQDLTVA